MSSFVSSSQYGTYGLTIDNADGIVAKTIQFGQYCSDGFVNAPHDVCDTIAAGGSNVQVVGEGGRVVWRAPVCEATGSQFGLPGPVCYASGQEFLNSLPRSSQIYCEPLKTADACNSSSTVCKWSADEATCRLDITKA